MSQTEETLPLLGLREPLSDVIDDDAALARACAELSLGSGPIALDAERASGYRYSQRAYLIQVRRVGSGTFLIDPIGCEDLRELTEAFADAEWILHAATQDLPCLDEVGLRPQSLFDTELAGRLLNLPRVGLSGLVEHYLGMTMAKEYSAVDWSTRPIPKPWLEYAALDVEVLPELRDAVAADLREQGKDEWARQDFEALLTFTGPPTRIDPWRRTSGIHKVRNPRALAVIRELWFARDAIAAERDVTPGKVLNDAALVQVALDPPTDLSQLRNHPAMRNSRARKSIDVWRDSIEQALQLPETDLPPVSGPYQGPPPVKAWAEKDPEAAGRLKVAREAVASLATELNVPAENLLKPQIIRELMWDPPADGDAIESFLAEHGARPWQIDLTLELLRTALDR